MYIIFFSIAFVLSLFLTFVVAIAMHKLRIVDIPSSADRKIHKKKIPLGGGLAIFGSFFLVIAVLQFWGTHYFQHEVVGRNLFGLFIGGLILMVGGFLDDKYNLKARYQFIFPILSALTVIGFGIGPHSISNPFGGQIDLAMFKISIDHIGTLVVFADMLVFAWLFGMMFTTKLLDGLDGLVAGVAGIGAIIVFFLSMQKQWYQPEVAMLSVVFAGACLGFLVWNWHPAKIFLGEGGSLFAGFMLGSLAIISGGKIATTLLVVGIPVLDTARVIIRRIQKKQPVYVGDSEHLHFRLINSGLTQKQAVLLLYSISLSFGLIALFLQTKQKFIALGFLFVLMVLVGVWFRRKEKKEDLRRLTYMLQQK